EERPDNSDDDSFPSGHTANAFASATTLYRRYGWQAGVPAYAVATLTGVARERSRQHHWYDVVAGAAIGGISGWFFTDAFNDKVQLVPWVDSKGGGVAVSMRW
ncbi:MAG: phosphatase PAP2 family protein, partial [Gammaproteobacteria bacterium]